jgi:hypothetical protein
VKTPRLACGIQRNGINASSLTEAEENGFTRGSLEMDEVTDFVAPLEVFNGVTPGALVHRIGQTLHAQRPVKEKNQSVALGKFQQRRLVRRRPVGDFPDERALGAGEPLQGRNPRFHSNSFDTNHCTAATKNNALLLAANVSHRDSSSRFFGIAPIPFLAAFRALGR